MGEEISSKKFVTVVLGSFPGSCDNFLISLNARDAEELDWENVKGLLTEEYMKHKEKNERQQESDNTLFTRKDRGGIRGANKQHGGAECGFSGTCGGRGGNHWRNQGNRTADSGARYKNSKCWNCNGFGHLIRDCPNNKNDQNQRRSERVNMVDESESDNDCKAVALISSTTNEEGD